MTSGTKDIPALTGLRFFAAFAILLNHLLLGFVPRSSTMLAPGLGFCGELGMSIFFVLSGFIIHYNYCGAAASLNRAGLWRFFVARFARLYPLYICVVLFDLWLLADQLNWGDVRRAIPYYLTLTQTTVYRPASGQVLANFIPHASLTWSISTEFVMYAVYPLIGWALIRDRMPLKVSIVGGALFILLISIVTNWLYLNRYALIDPEPTNGRLDWWLFFMSPYMRIWEFLIGAIVAHLHLRSSSIEVTRRELTWGSAMLSLAVVFICAALVPPDLTALPTQLRHFIGADVVIGVIIFCLARYRDALVTRVVSLKPLLVLGERSYSIYLLQLFVYATVPAGLIKAPLIGIPVAWLALLAVSHLTYQGIEVPARRALRAILAAKPDPATVVEPAPPGEFYADFAPRVVPKAE